MRMSNSGVSLVFGLSWIDRDRDRRTGTPRQASESGIINPYSRLNTTQLGNSTIGKVTVRNPYKKTILGDKGTFSHFTARVNESSVSVDSLIFGWHGCNVMILLLFLHTNIISFFSFHVSLMGWSPVRYVWHIIDLLDGFILLDYKLICFASILFWICFAFRW